MSLLWEEKKRLLALEFARLHGDYRIPTFDETERLLQEAYEAGKAEGTRAGRADPYWPALPGSIPLEG